VARIGAGLGRTAFHGLATLGTGWRAFGLRPRFDSDGAQLLTEAALLGETLALRLFLADQHVDRPAQENEHGVGENRVIVGLEPVREFPLLGENVDARVMHDIVAVVRPVQPRRIDRLSLGRILAPRHHFVTQQPVLVIAVQLGEAGACDICQLHLGLFGGAGARRALHDVHLAGSRGLGHLVVLAAGRVERACDELRAETEVRELDDAGHDPGIQPPVTA